MRTSKQTQRVKMAPKTLLLLLALITGDLSFAQDRIVMKDGSEINAKVMETNLNEVKYYVYDNQNGPLRIISTRGVFMIVYENGSKQVLDRVAQQTSARPSPRIQKLQEEDPLDVYENDTTDFAYKKRKKFSGPRVGITYIGAGTSADYLAKEGKQPVMTQFGWQFETRLFTVQDMSGILEFVPAIGGVEQGLFVPSASVLLGLRGGEKNIFEFALGPNFSVVPNYKGVPQGFAGLVVAVGTSLRKGNVYFPINIAFVPSVGSTADIYNSTTGTTTTQKFDTGFRLTLIAGFNTRSR
jgi:hypothetical protein